MPYIGFWGALIVAPILTAALGLVVERLLIRPLYGGDPLYGLLLTFGLAYIFEDVTRFIWGAQSLPFQVPGWLTTPLSSQFFFLTGYRVFMIVIVAAAVGGLFAVLNYTRLGMRIRAGTRDLDTVSTLGVNVRVLRSLNFGIGIYIAGLAGVLAAGLLGLSPTIGASLIMPSFVAIIVGGLGSLLGTLLGGLLIGVASGLAAVFFPSATEAVIYVMMGLVLLVRPRGLLGEEGRAALSAARARAFDVAVCRRASVHAVLDGGDRRLYRARDPHRRHGAGGDVAQLPARLHRHPVVRPRRLFRARRLWRGDGDQVSRPRHDSGDRARGRRRDASPRRSSAR